MSCRSTANVEVTARRLDGDVPCSDVLAMSP
jgi:hypothetical protein